MSFIDVRHPDTGKLLLQYDPVRRVVAVLHRHCDPVTGRHVATIEQVELDAYAPPDTSPALGDAPPAANT